MNPPGACLNEGQLHQWFNLLTLNLKELEGTGVEVPSWCWSMCGAGLVLLKQGTLSRYNTLLMLAGIWSACRALPPDLLSRLERKFGVEEIPDGVGPDLDMET